MTPQKIDLGTNVKLPLLPSTGLDLGVTAKLPKAELPKVHLQLSLR